MGRKGKKKGKRRERLERKREGGKRRGNVASWLLGEGMDAPGKLQYLAQFLYLSFCCFLIFNFVKQQMQC